MLTTQDKIIKDRFAYTEDGQHYYINDRPVTIEEFIAKAPLKLSLRKEIEEMIEVSRGNDYHNMGMGELDYHEKSAVDAYIETLKHRLEKL